MRGPLPLFLRVVGVLDLQPPDACTFEVVRAHQLEEFAPPAGDGERLGYDWRPLRQNALQPPATLAEPQRSQVGAVEPEDIESHVIGAPRHAEQLVELRSA